MRASEVRIPRARLFVAVAALAGSAAILWMTQGFTFYFDEWDYILAAPDWTWTSYLQPHNVHPTMLPRLIYAGLLATVGLRSYMPYMTVLLTLHAANVILLFEIVRRRAGDLVGVACAAVLLVIGAGWENLIWAFQMGFVGSVACGLAMLLALQASRTPRRMPVVAMLLTASLMFSGIGLFFGVAAAVMLAASPGRRKDLLWLAPVAIALGAWWLAYGRSGAPTNPPSSAANLVLLPLYAVWGLGASAAGLIGEGGPVGPVLLVLASVAISFSWWRRRPDPLALGVVAAIVAFYLVTGLNRAQLGYQQSGSGRYVYEGAVFWLILLADAARNLPWRGTWRPALIACLFLACFNSGALLFTFVAAKTVQMQQEVADLNALTATRSDPCLNPNAAVDPLVMPQVTAPPLYYRAVDRYGDPASGLPLVDHLGFARAYRNLRTGCP